MSISETDILKPRSPSLPEDDWAEFTLSNVSVAYEESGRPASLLAAYANCPLTVRGRLETPERQHAHHLLRKPYRPTDIVVRNVTRFAYAEMGDGSYALWALGEAGWFTIEGPAGQYRGVYEADIQAVEVLYFLIDCNSETAGKKGAGPSAELLYREYAEKARYQCTDAAEAERIFYRHREFLLMSFLQRTYGIVWSNTPIYQTFRRQFPTDFERCKARHEGRFDEMKRPCRSRPVPKASSDDAPKKDDNWWESATLFEFMQKAVNQRVIRAGRSSITVSRVAALMTKRFEIEDVQTATNVLLVHGRNLCYMMDHPRRQNIRFFAAEPIYGELAAGHGLSAAEQRRAEAVELRHRRHASRGESESSDTDEVVTPKRSGRSRKGTLSVLRPSGKFSGKGRGKAPIVEDGSGDEDEDEDEDGMQTSPSGKRKLETVDKRETDDERKRLRGHETGEERRLRSHETDEERNLRGHSTTPSSPTPPLPLNYPSTCPSQPALTSTLVSTPLPTYTPNGPRDSWICTFDGCAQRIYGCSGETGRGLIREHLADHAGGVERAVGILWGEGEALRLPVSHLVRRIREMGEAGVGGRL